MQGILYEEQSLLVFLFVTVILGGAGAWMTGRACAITWRPLEAARYLPADAVVRRALHPFRAVRRHAAFAVHYWLVDLIFLLIVGYTAYRYTMANQMVSQYYWLYEKAGAFSWRDK